MTRILTEIRKLAERHGIEFIDRGHGHIQLRGKLLVNYYPESAKRSAYVAGTTAKRVGVTPAQAIAMTWEPPPFKPGQQKRKQQTSAKRRLFKKQKRCHWCGCKLTVATATVDHRIPLSRGGLDNDNNRVISCAPCNHGRGHAMPEITQQNAARG